jgi:hypothetical protein
MFNPLELTGRSSTHVRAVPELGCILHSEAASQALAMRAAARAVGIELAVVSSFRDFYSPVGMRSTWASVSSSTATVAR